MCVLFDVLNRLFFEEYFFCKHFPGALPLSQVRALRHSGGVGDSSAIIGISQYEFIIHASVFSNIYIVLAKKNRGDIL